MRVALMQIAGARGYRSASPPPEFLSIAKKKREEKKAHHRSTPRASAPVWRDMPDAGDARDTRGASIVVIRRGARVIG